MKYIYTVLLRLKATSKILPVLFIFSINNFCIGQQPSEKIAFPVSYHGKTNYTNAVYGYIVLMNADTLKGIIDITNGTNDIPFLPLDKNQPSDVILIKRENISFIRIYKPLCKDSINIDTSFTDFVNLNGRFLWRLVLKGNDVSIYNNYFGGQSFKNQMIMDSKFERVKMFNYISYKFHRRNLKFLLLKFINKRYKTELREKDFNSTNDTVRYLVHIENDKKELTQK